MFKKPSIIFLLFFSVVVITLKVLHPYHNFISYDNFGYYMHLPARFIYHDPQLKTGWFEQVSEKYNNVGHYSQTATTKENERFMRYYMGMSYVWTPPFFAAHLYAKAKSYEADGFSIPYQNALIYYGVIFMILGVIFSRKILLHYFTEKITTSILIIFFTGTSIFYFGTIGNDVPHIYLFTLFAALIWYTIRWHEKPSYRYIIPLSALLGLIIAIRPSDIFISLFPILWGAYNKETIKQKLQIIAKNKYQVLTGIMICILFILPQLFYYYQSTGSILLNIYNEPSSPFDFWNPRILYVLFGFRKGWFIYSTLSILGFIGLVFVFRKLRSFFWPVVIYYIILIYLVASFDSLTSFGWRAFLQSNALLLIPAGFLIEYISHQKLIFKTLFSVIILFFIILNIHQAYQISEDVLSASRMTKEYYFAILGKNKADASDKRLLLIDRPENQIDFLPLDRNYKYITLLQRAFENEKLSDSLSPKPYHGNGMLLLSPPKIYSPGFSAPYNEICQEYYCYIRISVYVYSDTPVENEIFLVTDTKNKKGQSVKWSGITVGHAGNKFVPGRWNKMTSYYLTPEIHTNDEVIEAYIWYTGKNKVWIDDLNIGAFIPEDNTKPHRLNSIVRNDIDHLKKMIENDSGIMAKLNRLSSETEISVDSLITEEAVWFLKH